MKIVSIIAATFALGGALHDASAGAPLTGVAQIASGGSHVCATMTDGAVRCWGRNRAGQLGNGTVTDALSAAPMPSLQSGVAAVAAGFEHSCALMMSGGAVKCWGENTSGQLGTGNLSASRIPLDVIGLRSGVKAIVAGSRHSCALTTTGGVKCWGSNSNGELGNGTTTQATTPVDVAGLQSGVAAIAAGTAYTCALTNSGGAKCWGANDVGQLGNGLFMSSSIAVDVSGLSSGATTIDAGDTHACAATPGGVKCWGTNYAGQLGNGTTTWAGLPVDANTLPAGVTSLALGHGFSCALTAAQDVLCVGVNGNGALGNGTLADRVEPTYVVRLGAPVQSITAAGFQACALLGGGTVKCWGANGSGEAGNGTAWIEPSPTALPMLGNYARDLSPGGTHSCMVTSWGGCSAGARTSGAKSGMARRSSG